MLYSLRGPLVLLRDSFAVVECGGVGYRFALSAPSAAALSAMQESRGEVLAYTYLNVRQDGIDLFGFADEREQELFLQLIGVTGVGPKAALAILSILPPAQLSAAILQENTAAITRAPGVGAKLAGRIVMELRDKVDRALAEPVPEAPSAVPLPDSSEDAVKALVMLGYPRGEARRAVSSLDASLPLDDLIRRSLQLLYKG